MPGTNAYALKAALVDWLQTLPGLATQPDLAAGYSAEAAARGGARELVYPGKAEGPQEYALFGGGNARYKRDETVTIKLYIDVLMPGASQQEAEQRAVEIGTLIEEAIAAGATIPALGGVIKAGVVGVELDGDIEDDNAMGFVAYDIAVQSRLT